MGHTELIGLIDWDFVSTFSCLSFLPTIDFSCLVFVFPTGKGFGAPLAFRCIKSNGGPVPRTLVGVTRIYPVLYKERSFELYPVL